MQSVTSMFDCTHGPKKDCHACLVGELVEALRQMMWGFNHRGKAGACQCSACERARAVLEKAKLIEDCIPIEEAEEASRT